MSRLEFLTLLLNTLIFMLGAGIGSFLNVVIYRLPLGISVNNPRRSFCPSCKKQIPWYRNLPLITWVAQGGKCAECGSKIAFRYFFVELLTGCLFFAVYYVFGGPWEHLRVWGPVVLCYWVFVALLVSGTFIDFDHYILPLEITIGGIIAGILGSYWAPALMKETDHSRGIVISFLSACVAAGLLKTVVELGKLALGRKKHTFEKPEPWSLTQPDEKEPPLFTFAGEELLWIDIFTRPSDRLIISGNALTINDRSFGEGKTEINMETVKVTPNEGEPVTYKLEEVKKLEGQTTQVIIPREAMGDGDVLLLAMIAAFLGWQASIFTIVAASFLGSFFGIVPRFFGKTESKIPFGPYLSAAALIWLFWNPQIIRWYQEFVFTRSAAW